jgi:4-nitrophenyl phosphatase
LFVTNNSTKSREDYKKVFAKFGIEVSADEVISSSSAVAHYLKDEAHFTKTAYVVGEAGITRELDALGISWIGGVVRSLLLPVRRVLARRCVRVWCVVARGAPR